MALAAPALAVAPPIIVTLDAGVSCKETQSSKKYYLAFSIKNTGSGTAEVRATALSVTPNSGSTITLTGGLPTAWESVAGGGTILLDYTSEASGDIANGTATATFEVRDPSGVVLTVTQTFNIARLDPCKCVPAPCAPSPTPTPTATPTTSAPAPSGRVAEEPTAESSTSTFDEAEQPTVEATTAPADVEESDAGAEPPASSDGGRG